MVEAKIDTDKKIFFVLILLLLVFGIKRAYAYFSAKSNTSTQTINTASFEVEVANNGILRATNIVPINTVEMKEKATALPFTVKNTGDTDFTATINFNIESISEELKTSDFKWALYEDDNEIAVGSFLNVSSAIKLKDNISISANTYKDYTFYVWIEETGIKQDELQNKSLKGKITVNANQ